MQDRFGVSIGSISASVIPLLCGLLGAFAANIPISFSGGLIPPPLFALMPVYFWCLVRPDLMPPWVAFAIGVTEDLLSGGPPGVWAASFMACYAFVGRERDLFAGMAGYGAILGFAAATMLTTGTAYLIVSLYYSRLVPISPLMVEVGVSVVCYVPALWAMNRIQHGIIGPLRSAY